MAVTSITIEFLRFGDETGVLRVSDAYIRTKDNSPASEVQIPIAQENLNAAMDCLDYSNFLAGSNQNVVRRAESVFEQLEAELEQALNVDSKALGADGPLQIDIVTRANEIAQLPFEVLEEGRENWIVTRRIRQPWPSPPLVCQKDPDVLFVWAEPDGMSVPADEHREELDRILSPLGRKVTEIENATIKELSSVLGKRRFTHVHFLVHGEKPRNTPDFEGDFRLNDPPLPQVFLALEDEDGGLARMSPEALAALFEKQPRPEAVTIATCHGAELDPIASGATLAHAVHNVGVPIVLASQLALTQNGSIEFVRTFLDGLVVGKDPRLALKECRQALAENKERTYYDRVAVVGYAHLASAHQAIWREREFEKIFRDLKKLSDDANEKLEAMRSSVKGRLTAAQKTEAERVSAEFKKVRDDLKKRTASDDLTSRQREELHGLRANSYKREAEASWKLCRPLTGVARKQWIEKSKRAFRSARDGYRVAAGFSRDHHWARSQWLVCEAMIRGTLEHMEIEWFTAFGAAQDLISRDGGDHLTEVGWAFGSMAELQLLAPLVGYEEETEESEHCLRQLVGCKEATGVDYLVSGTLAQFERYESWWGKAYSLPEEIVQRALELRDFLKAHDN